LPEEVFSNAGWGTKAGYWAVVNYGSDYIGTTEVTIDIQPEAIANTEVNVIGVMETGHTDQAVYYKRNIDAGFSTRVNYRMQNSNYGEKAIAILLLREISPNPTDSLIIDKIIIDVDQKRNISEFTEEDILITPEVNEDVFSMNPYNITVGINADTIVGEIEDYVLKSVTYKLTAGSNPTIYQAIETGNVNDYNVTLITKDRIILKSNVDNEFNKIECVKNYFELEQTNCNSIKDCLECPNSGNCKDCFKKALELMEQGKLNKK
jgi:hypothetical protein